MPYVTVWVDDDPRDDDRLATMRAALAKLKDGDVLSATRILAVATDDDDVRREREKEAEIADLFAKWRAEPEPRPDFLTFAHHRRRLTAA